MFRKIPSGDPLEKIHPTPMIAAAASASHSE